MIQLSVSYGMPDCMTLRERENADRREWRATSYVVGLLGLSVDARASNGFARRRRVRFH